MVYSLFFSPTRTTEKVSKRIAGKISPDFKAINILTPESRTSEQVFTADDIVIVGFPTYAGRIPNLLLPYFGKLEGNGAKAIALVTYGNRACDDSLTELVRLLQDRGFQTIAAASFIGEHSFSTTLGKRRPDDEDFKTADDFALKISEKIEKGDNSLPKGIDMDREIKPYYRPQDRNGEYINILKVKPKFNPDRCVYCKTCVEVCPMGSIKAEDVSTVNGICIKCNACVKRCPENARYFDDEGYLYHKQELEFLYENPRKEPELYL